MESVPASVRVVSGRFVDNRRGRISVETLAADLLAITIDQPADPIHGHAASVTEIVLSGEHLEALTKALGKAARASRKALTVVPTAVTA